MATELVSSSTFTPLNNTDNSTLENNSTDGIEYLNKVFLLILIIVGIIGNILTILVLSNNKNRNVSTAILYLSLAVSDIHIIILNIALPLVSSEFDIALHVLSNLL